MRRGRFCACFGERVLLQAQQHVRVAHHEFVQKVASRAEVLCLVDELFPGIVRQRNDPSAMVPGNFPYHPVGVRIVPFESEPSRQMALERDDVLFLADRYPVEGMDEIGIMERGEQRDAVEPAVNLVEGQKQSAIDLVPAAPGHNKRGWISVLVD